MNEIWDCPIPVVAQVDGWCLAGATDIALSADIVVVSESAQIGHPGVQLQGVPTTNLWLYHVGPQVAKWMLLTGRTMSGNEAVERRLALTSAPSADLDEVALEHAQTISLIGRDLLIANKSVINFGVDLMGRRELQRFAVAQDAIAHASHDNLDFVRRVQEIGMKNAIAERQARFARR